VAVVHITVVFAVVGVVTEHHSLPLVHRTIQNALEVFKVCKRIRIKLLVHLFQRFDLLQDQLQRQQSAPQKKQPQLRRRVLLPVMEFVLLLVLLETMQIVAFKKKIIRGTTTGVVILKSSPAQDKLMEFVIGIVLQERR
jgi:hypothetical protein